MILNFIFFFIITTLSFFSIVGYGNLIINFHSKNKFLNNSIYFFLGLVFLNIIGVFLYYLNLDYKLLNLIILLSGLFFFKKTFNKKLVFHYLILNLILFSCILISKLHEDWSYHFGFIEQITNHEPIIGIGNAEDIHVLSTSFFSFVQKLFVLPYYNFSFVFVPSYLIFFTIVSVLVNLIIKEKKNIVLVLIMIFSLLVIKMSRLSEFGYDYLSNFILIYLVIFFILLKSKFIKIENSSLYILILFLFSVSIKISSILFFPIFLYMFIDEFKKKKTIIR